MLKVTDKLAINTNNLLFVERAIKHDQHEIPQQVVIFTFKSYDRIIEKTVLESQLTVDAKHNI